MEEEEGNAVGDSGEKESLDVPDNKSWNTRGAEEENFKVEMLLLLAAIPGKEGRHLERLKTLKSVIGSSRSEPESASMAPVSRRRS